MTSCADSCLAIGLMSGTSVDGVDAALVEVGLGDGKASFGLRCRLSHPMPREVRDGIFRLFEDGAGSLHEAALMNFRIGEVFAEAALALLAKSGKTAREIAVIGSHGQTVHHVSLRESFCGSGLLATLQIGEGSVIARRTGIVTASDFRTADIAAGGTGAPLVPVFDALFFAGQRRVAVQNIGGIGNVSWIGEPGEPVLAFDTGPGNMLVDLLAERLSGGSLRCDLDGRIGRTGRVLEDVLAGWMGHGFLSRPLPKSAGREEFGTVFLRERLGDRPASADLVRTAEEFTARSIAASYRDYLPAAPAKVVVTGGGARNPVILEALRANLPPGTAVVTGGEAGIDSDFKEAVAFALLGVLCLRHAPVDLSGATGARHPAVLGKLSWP